MIGRVTTMDAAQFAQSRPPRSYTGTLNSNLPSGKSMVLANKVLTRDLLAAAQLR